MLNTENIQSLIDSGEGYNVEFKVRVPSKVRELTEEICAFANADGGYVLIGVGVNLAVSFSCIVGCPICKIYLVDHGYRNFKEKIHFME